ncbi:MAG: ABC transporter substrate-binding protein [Actinomycetota bacterium]|nr:ABC transporter substrate-binding protein [Actinomycetota bacterium]
MRFRSLVRVVALVAALGLVATACKSGGGTGNNNSSGPHKGGSITVAAEQWPQCLNPIDTCRSASWLFYTVLNETMPRLVEWSVDGVATATPIIKEVPSLENGGLTADPFSLTYHFTDAAMWADGTPMTSADIDFTWKAIMNTKGTADTVGYENISSIDTTDPKTAVINFKKVYVPWPDLFGGNDFGFLEAAAFPDQMDSETPDLSGEMLTEIPFSGGPWILDSWGKQSETLIPNPHFAGGVALLDKVVMVKRAVVTTEINSVLSGDAAAIYPQPGASALADSFATNPAVSTGGSNSTYTEALWFNVCTTGQGSLSCDGNNGAISDPKVREAMSYAVDRQAIIDAIIKLNNPTAEISNCGLLDIPGTPWCDDTTFAGYTYDPAKAKEILTGDGYDCTGAQCTKDGKPLEISYEINEGNDRRAATAALVKERAADAGITLNIEVKDATQYFEDLLPKGEYQMAEYASGGYYDPSVTSSFACDQVPSADNNQTGGNWDYWCNADATKLMHDSDSEVDQTKRISEIHDLGKIEATNTELPALPLFNLPNVWAWNTDQVAGPVGKWGPTNYGLFYNMQEWYVP